MVNVYERIRNIREDLDYKQYQFAKDIGVKPSTYSLYENNLRAIPLNILDKIAIKLNTNVDYLLGISDKRKYRNSKPMDMEILITNLKKYRKINNLKQIDVANYLHCTRQAWGNYEQGIRIISIDKLYDFAKLVNISVDTLIGKIDYCPLKISKNCYKEKSK